MTTSETKSVAVKEKNVDSENNIVAKDVTPDSKAARVAMVVRRVCKKRPKQLARAKC